MIIKGRSPRMRHVEGCAWLVIWQNQLGHQKSNSNMLTPKKPTRWHANQREFLTRWMESPSPSTIYQHFQLCQPLRKGCHKEQEKRELWQSRSQRWTLFSQTATSSPTAPSLSASNRPKILRAPSHSTKCRETCRWRLKSEWRRVEFLSVAKRDAKMNDIARKLAASGTNQDLSFQEMCKDNLPRKILWPTTRTTRRSRTTSTYLVLTFHISRKSTRICDSQLNRKPEDTKEDLDVNTLIWWMFMTVTLQAAGHLGNDYLENQNSTTNRSQRTVKHLFDVRKKLVRDQKEIQGVSVVDWQQTSWRRTTLLTDLAVQLSTAKNLRILLLSVVHVQNQWKFRKRIEGENRLVYELIHSSVEN